MRSLLKGVRGWLWPMAFLWLCLVGIPAIAQPDDSAGAPDAGQDAEQAAPDPDGEVPVTDQPGGIQAANESAAEESGDEDGDEGEEEGSGAGRFIPSEQISQDLGVSFPADI